MKNNGDLSNFYFANIQYSDESKISGIENILKNTHPELKVTRKLEKDFIELSVEFVNLDIRNTFIADLKLAGVCFGKEPK